MKNPKCVQHFAQTEGPWKYFLVFGILQSSKRWSHVCCSKNWVFFVVKSAVLFLLFSEYSTFWYNQSIHTTHTTFLRIRCQRGNVIFTRTWVEVVSIRVNVVQFNFFFKRGTRICEIFNPPRRRRRMGHRSKKHGKNCLVTNWISHVNPNLNNEKFFTRRF